MFAQQAEQLIRIAPLAMMRFLVQDISLHYRNVYWLPRSSGGAGPSPPPDKQVRANELAGSGSGCVSWRRELKAGGAAGR